MHSCKAMKPHLSQKKYILLNRSLHPSFWFHFLRPNSVQFRQFPDKVNFLVAVVFPFGLIIVQVAEEGSFCSPANQFPFSFANRPPGVPLPMHDLVGMRELWPMQ